MRNAGVIVWASIIVGAAPTAWGQEQVVDEVVSARARDREKGREPGDLTFALSPRFEHDFAGGLKDSDAESSVTRAGLNLDLTSQVTARWQLSLNVNAEASWYNWDDAATLLPGGGDPIGNAYEVTVSPGLAYGFDSTWTVIGGAIVQFSFEDGADIGNSVTYGGFAGVRYTVNERLSFTVGAVVKTRLENDASVFPLINVRWKITDRVTLAGEGAGLRLSARVNESWVVSIFGRYERREFRLDEDGSAPIPDGVARDTRVPIGVGLTWEPRPGVRIGIEGGAIVYQEYVFDDAAGERIFRDRSDAHPFVGVSGRIEF